MIHIIYYELPIVCIDARTSSHSKQERCKKIGGLLNLQDDSIIHIVHAYVTSIHIKRTHGLTGAGEHYMQGEFSTENTKEKISRISVSTRRYAV